MLAGRDGTWRVMAVTPTTLTLAPLAGATLPTSSSIVTAAAVPGPHGGLTVVHGGGNTALDVEVSGTTTAPTAGTLAVARADGLAWSVDGYAIGQHVTVAGQAGVWRITGFANTACPLSRPVPGLRHRQPDAAAGPVRPDRRRREPDRRPRRRRRPAAEAGRGHDGHRDQLHHPGRRLLDR